jgi:hypothetical protein
MIDYIKLYNEFGQNNIPVYIFLITALIISIITLILMFISFIWEERKELSWKEYIVTSFLFLFSLSFFLVFLFSVYKSLKTEPTEQLNELKKYNIKNVENFRNNVELLEKELEFYDEKENKINEILNEFYKPSGKVVDKEIMKKLKK